MATTYEIWETRSNNVVGTYVTEGAALAAVSAQVSRHGKDAVESWTLLRETDDDEVVLLASSQELVDCALRYSTGHVPSASA
jgi:hypothetical protein